MEISAPRIDPLYLQDLSDSSADRLAAGEYFEGERFTGIDDEQLWLSATAFTECELLEWNVHEIDLGSSRLVETRVDRVTAPTFGVRRSFWRDVQLESLRSGAVEWYDSELSQVTVTNSKLGWVNLRSAQLRDVVFRDCTIDELDLSGANLVRVAFENCVVDKLIITGAQTQHFDLRGIDLRVIEGLDGLRGAVLSGVQVTAMAELFAAHLGITIVDET